ncbi:MAG: hypothetical protein GY852_02300 [bacterium]|nr:hypothetical protein [bacterium]
MDLDKILVTRVRQASNSFVGKRVLKISEKIGGASAAAALNILFTGILGFIITFPIYELEGIWLALPTGIFTLILLLFLSISILSRELHIGNKYARGLLVFAILFSLPFGLLSLPLLHELSENKKK